jgi:hypothetical protein
VPGCTSPPCVRERARPARSEPRAPGRSTATFCLPKFSLLPHRGVGLATRTSIIHFKKSLNNTRRGDWVYVDALLVPALLSDGTI